MREITFHYLTEKDFKYIPSISNKLSRSLNEKSVKVRLKEERKKFKIKNVQITRIW